MPAERIAPKECDAEINGLKLHYLDWGTEGRPPFVLLHGFSAHARYWDSFAVHMRDDYHVYALDQRGHGDSAWADEYPPESMVSDLDVFVDRLGLQRFVLLGHSMGGGVAFRYAAEHPERVEKLIIVDSALPNPERIAAPNPNNSVQRSLANDQFASEDEVFGHLMRQSPGANPDRVREVIPYWFRRQNDGRYTFKFDPKLRNRIGNGSPEQLEQLRRAATELRSKINRITFPTLLLRGENSDFLSPEAAQETVQALPNATLVTVPHTGHNIPSDDPRAFRAAVKEWLGQIP
jgi:esterase